MTMRLDATRLDDRALNRVAVDLSLPDSARVDAQRELSARAERRHRAQRSAGLARPRVYRGPR